jgi:predicted permease
MLADLAHRLRSIFRRHQVERELADELEFHIEHEIDKRVAAGVPRAEALRQARLALGGMEQIKEQHRDARGTAPIDTLVQDVRYGLRTMRRAPVFAVTATATIALSTAALATVFTLGDTLLFRRLPVERPDEIVAVAGVRAGPSPDAMSVREAVRLRELGPVSYPDYVTFRDRTTALSGLAAHYPTAPLFVSLNGRVGEVNGAVVSSNFFRLLGIAPAVGRFFHDDEDRVPDRDRVAVLGHDFWRTWFAASPAAVGSSIRINGSDFTIVGVAPANFVALTSSPIELYIPTMMLRVGYRWCDDALAADCTVLQMIGRLAPGRTEADAAAELPTLMPPAWREAKRGENRNVGVISPRGVAVDTDEERLVHILGGVAVVLLLVCCANLAGLLSARSISRAGEFRIRLSLGAASGRIVRQLMTESMMLALAGGVGGVALSRVFVGGLRAMFYAMDDEGHPKFYDFSLTPAVVVTALVAAVLAGCLFTIVPALVTAGRRGLSDLQPRGATSRWSSGRWLLGAQAAVAVALVAVGALLAGSARVMVAGRNFEASHIALMRLRPRLVKYPPERAQRFQREAIDALGRVPAVESVSMVGTGAVLGGGRALVGLPQWGGEERLRVNANEIGPNYFSTLHTPLVGGREFDEGDATAAPLVAVVNETLARRLWPNGGALGATLAVRNEMRQIVGIVTDVPLKSRGEAPEPWVFVPFWQSRAMVDSRLAIRVSGDPAAMLPALVRAVNRVDPDVPIAETITLPIQMKGWMRPLRVAATFVGYAAMLAIVLTAIGLYGALAFAVSSRTREIGIRMALGAPRMRIVRSIVREGLTVVVAGAAAGLALAVAGTRVLRHMLYGSADADWISYATAAALVLVVGLLASLTPARRAASVEPLVALRCD